jgi:hypothetical protein
MEEMRNVYKIFIGKPGRIRTRGRPRQRWEDNIIWILEKQGGKVWAGFFWLRIGTNGGFL